MSAVLTPPQPPAARARTPDTVTARLWTADEFNHLGSLGFFEGRRPFLIDGVIWEQGPMNEPHADGVVLLNGVLQAAFGPNWTVRVQLPLNIDAMANPFPDLAVVAGGFRANLGRPHPTTADLVAEVSDTTFTTDTTVKAERYARAGIPEYWVLDLEGRQLLVCRDPAPHPVGGHVYRTQWTLGPADTVSPLAAPNATIRVADLLP